MASRRAVNASRASSTNAGQNSSCSARGLSLVERNYQCKLGEIDLIMRSDDTLVFVEVRYRKATHFGGAAASVSPAKQQRLRRAALSYLQSKGLNESRQSCRFDLVACEGTDINWIANAF
jgi:putative endonuclease